MARLVPLDAFSMFDTPEMCPAEIRALRAESCGKLSPDERALAAPVEPHPLAVDGAISTLLLASAYAPEDYLCVLEPDMGGPSTGERENAYSTLRLTTGYALQMPTPANLEAIGRAVLCVVRLAMNARAHAALDEIEEG